MLEKPSPLLSHPVATLWLAENRSERRRDLVGKGITSPDPLQPLGPAAANGARRSRPRFLRPGLDGFCVCPVERAATREEFKGKRVSRATSSGDSAASLGHTYPRADVQRGHSGAPSLSSPRFESKWPLALPIFAAKNGEASTAVQFRNLNSLGRSPPISPESPWRFYSRDRETRQALNSA